VGNQGLDLFQFITDTTAGDDLALDLSGRIADAGGNKKTIELRLGEWEGADLLAGILGGNNHKGLGKGMGHSFDGHTALLHRFEEGALSAGHGAIEFIDQKDVAKDWAGDKTKIVDRTIKDRQTGDIGGEEITGALYPTKKEAGGAGQSQSQGGLAETGTIFEKEVAAAEEGDDRQLQGFVFAGEMLAIKGVKQAEDRVPFVLCHVNSFKKVFFYLTLRSSLEASCPLVGNIDAICPDLLKSACIDRVMLTEQSIRHLKF
jgi:hypothetical protein